MCFLPVQGIPKGASSSLSFAVRLSQCKNILYYLKYSFTPVASDEYLVHVFGDFAHFCASWFFPCSVTCSSTLVAHEGSMGR